MEKNIDVWRARILEIDENLECRNQSNVITLIETNLEESKLHSEAYHYLFKAYYHHFIKSNTELFIESLTHASGIESEDSFIWVQYGQAHIMCGNSDLGNEIVDKAIDMEDSDNFFCLLAKSKVLLYLKRYNESLNFCDRILSLNSNHYQALMVKGINLSNLHRYDRAIESYKHARSLCNSFNNKLLRDLATAYDKNDDHDNSIRIFKQAIELNQNDYKAFCGLGLTLSSKGKKSRDIDVLNEALTMFDKALEIKNNHFMILRNKGMALHYLGKNYQAYKSYTKAIQFIPDNDKNSLIFQRIDYERTFIYALLDENEQVKAATAGNIPNLRSKGAFEGFIEAVRNDFGSSIEEFYEEKTNAQEELSSLLNDKSKINPNCSFFISLRMWNSYTPAFSINNEERSLGGGYFFFHNKTGTVVDPGYNFIENFLKAKLCLADIDNIIITHAHNDHTMDFESILTLCHQRYKNTNGNCKKINIYLNQGASLKFSHLINWRKTKYINNIYVLIAGNEFCIDDAGSKIKVLPAYHDEWVTTKHSIGIYFSFKFNNNYTNVLLTSDTALYPSDNNPNIHNNGQVNNGMEIYHAYEKFIPSITENVDFIITHLGSIGDEELKPRIVDTKLSSDWIEYTNLYENHLGVIGVLRIIKHIQPKLALVAEFGEELKKIRYPLLNLMSSALSRYIGDCTILPAEIGLYYDLKCKKIFCPFEYKLKPANDVGFYENKHNKNDYTIYYSSSDDTIRRFKDLESALDTITEPYLNSVNYNILLS